MANNNQLILLDLQNSVKNAEDVKRLLPKWNKEESNFPVDDIKQYIKMQFWEYSDFDFEMEELVKEYLPDFMLDIFFEMKEFRKNKRNELSSSVEFLSNLMGYPMKTQDDKAFCLYNYMFQRYFENSQLNKGDKNEQQN